MIRRPRLELIDLIRELTQTTNHRELYIRKRAPRYHVTNNPPLLVQLARAARPANHDDSISAGTGSRPAANLDAIDAHNRIHQAATDWLNHLHQPNAGDPTITLVRHLGAVAPHDRCNRRTPHRATDQRIDCCIYHAIESDVRRWWSWARIVTGWDTPAWRPDNTCPHCGIRGTLRIRFTDRLAICSTTGCQGIWDEATITLLADHIRTENGESQAS